MKKWYLGALSGFLLLAALTFPVFAQSLEEKVIEHTLENGLTLLLYERHQTPIVSCNTYINVGSANDELGETGIAHMTEHIAFKGTKTIGTKNYDKEKKLLEALDDVWNAIERERVKGEDADQTKLTQLHKEFTRISSEASQYVVSEEYSRIMEENGAVGLNAATSRDNTQYFVSLPSNRLELWMMLEADRLMNPVPREFYKERQVIMEERSMRTDTSPLGTLVEQFLGIAFIAHPYGFPAIGWKSDIQTIKPAQLMEFFETYYTPSNMVISIVGDVQPDEAISLAEKYFGRLPARPIAGRIRTVEPPQAGERRVEVEWNANPYVVLGYHRPAVDHEDAVVFDVISFLLSGGRTSQLYKELVVEDRIAVHVDTVSAFPGKKYPTLFLLVAVPFGAHTVEDLEDALYSELDVLKTEVVGEQELQKVINNVEANYIKTLTANSGLASQLGFAQSVFGDWRELENKVERIKNVTAKDVMRVANTYFTRKNRSVAWLVKKDVN